MPPTNNMPLMYAGPVGASLKAASLSQRVLKDYTHQGEFSSSIIRLAIGVAKERSTNRLHALRSTRAQKSFCVSEFR